jgi:hypothetical protein
MWFIKGVNVKLWRYLEYSKFVAMLKSRALHFSRADKFDNDPFEGSYPQKNIINYLSVASPNHTYEAFKKYAAVSCWHSNPDESEAMWELYLRNSDGVAIVTDKKTLEECLRSEATVIKIQYKDYRKDQIDDFTWFKAFEYKRKCFKHECEIRASIYRIPPSGKIVNGFPELGPPDGKNCIPEEGIPVAIDLKKLIKKIVISPKSGPWFEGVVKETLENYSLSKIKVVKSELSNDPLYPHWDT